MLVCEIQHSFLRHKTLKINDLHTVAIVGPGLLGGSIGLGLKAAGLNARIIGVGHRPSSIRKAVEIGAIDSGFLEYRPLEDAQLVIIATPIGLFETVLSQLADVLHAGAVITDVGSTKQHICRQAERILPDRLRFIGSHPMAGSEQRGIEFARADLFQSATCIITPTQTSSRPALGLVRSMWTILGMRLVRLSPAEHDAVLAKISHLPHIAAAALVNICTSDELKISGPGFLDTTRIASGDVDLWNDIIMSNPDHIRAAAKRLKQQIDLLEKAVEARDTRSIKQFLASAKRKRDTLVKSKIKKNLLA